MSHVRKSYRECNVCVGTGCPFHTLKVSNLSNSFVYLVFINTGSVAQGHSRQILNGSALEVLGVAYLN